MIAMKGSYENLREWFEVIMNTQQTFRNKYLNRFLESSKPQ